MYYNFLVNAKERGVKHLLKQFNKKDIDIIMKLWKDNNQRYQSFINNEYWINNYIKTRDEFLQNNIYVYTESAKILAYIVVNNNNQIIDIQVSTQIQREGIGKLLIEKLKSENDKLIINVYEKNINAVLFFKSLGFKKIMDKIDENVQEKMYIMQWNKGEFLNSSFIYFDNSILDEIIEKYDKLNKVQFYNIHTFTKETNNVFNIDISNGIEKKNGKTYIKDYIEVRNKMNSIIKNAKVTIYFDCNNDYSYLFDVIMDIVKIKGINLTVIMHKPFSIEGGKKSKMYEDIKNSFRNYNVVDVDYEEIGKDVNVTFKEAFDLRDEELVKMVCTNL